MTRKTSVVCAKEMETLAKLVDNEIHKGVVDKISFPWLVQYYFLVKWRLINAQLHFDLFSATNTSLIAKPTIFFNFPERLENSTRKNSHWLYLVLTHDSYLNFQMPFGECRQRRYSCIKCIYVHVIYNCKLVSLL